MPVLFKTSGGVPVSDYESLQSSYNNLNSEYNNYKSSHSHTNDEYNSYGESQYNSGYGNGVNAGKSKLSVIRFDAYGWNHFNSNVIDTGGTSTKTIYFAAAFKKEFNDSTATMYAQGSNDNSSWNNIVSKGFGGAGNSWEGTTTYRYFRIYYQGKYGGDSSAAMLAVKAD